MTKRKWLLVLIGVPLGLLGLSLVLTVITTTVIWYSGPAERSLIGLLSSRDFFLLILTKSGFYAVLGIILVPIFYVAHKWPWIERWLFGVAVAFAVTWMGIVFAGAQDYPHIIFWVLLAAVPVGALALLVGHKRAQ